MFSFSQNQTRNPELTDVRESSDLSGAKSNIDKAQEREEELIPVELPDLSIERLQELENTKHSVSGEALVQLMPQVLDSSFGLSPALTSAMDLSAEEELQVNGWINGAIEKLRVLEANNVLWEKGAGGEASVVIKPYPELGAKVKGQLLASVEKKFGAEKGAILKLQFEHASGIPGEFGREKIELGKLDFEKTYRREDLVTLQLKRHIPDSKEVLTEERSFFVSNFRKRFGHLFDLEEQ